jgi:hypothetical protein
MMVVTYGPLGKVYYVVMDSSGNTLLFWSYGLWRDIVGFVGYIVVSDIATCNVKFGTYRAAVAGMTDFLFVLWCLLDI